MKNGLNRIAIASALMLGIGVAGCGPSQKEIQAQQAEAAALKAEQAAAKAEESAAKAMQAAQAASEAAEKAAKAVDDATKEINRAADHMDQMSREREAAKQKSAHHRARAKAKPASEVASDGSAVPTAAASPAAPNPTSK